MLALAGPGCCALSITVLKMSSVTPQYLLEGYAYALEQCGLLLRDANILYRSGSYANTVVLAAFAGEELGRSEILLDLRKQVLGGKNFTTKDIREQCDGHVEKQQAGMLSVVQRASNQESGIGKVLLDRMTANSQSPEGQKVRAELEQITKRAKNRVPSDRHEARIAALYVEPVSGNKWKRPADTSRAKAQTFLQNAVNDYAMRYDQGYIRPPDSILKHIDPELFNALEQWSDRPELWRPERPHDAGADPTPTAHTKVRS
jgi:AbiV family abortive infection protein